MRHVPIHVSAKPINGEANPNAELFNELAAAGVSVRLCSQSMMGAGLAREEINPDAKVDVAAITTMATLQLRGYAIITD